MLRVGDAYLLEGTEGEEAHMPLWLPDSSAAVIFDGIAMDKFWVIPVPRAALGREPNHDASRVHRSGRRIVLDPLGARRGGG